MNQKIFVILIFLFFVAESSALDIKNNSHSQILLDCKHKADSILIDIYGESFFSKNITWRIQESYFIDLHWNKVGYYEAVTEKRDEILIPKIIVLRYGLIFSDYSSFEPIRILFDSEGEILSSFCQSMYQCTHNLGIDDSTNDFNSLNNLMTLDEALLAAKKEGYKPKHHVINKAAYIWRKNDSKRLELKNGQWMIYVIRYLKDHYDKDIPDAYFRKCDVWMFNPWTKEFLGKKKLMIREGSEEYKLFFTERQFNPNHTVKGHGFRDIFGSVHYESLYSYDSLTFFNPNNRETKKLIGLWLSPDSSPFTKKQDSCFLWFKDDKRLLVHNSSEDKLRQAKNNFEGNLWHSAGHRLRFYEKFKDRYDSDNNFFIQYKIRGKKLILFLDQEKFIFRRVN